MIPDGTYTAVVENLADDTAALLLVEEGDHVADLSVPAGELPGDARHRDAVLRVTVADGDLTGATYQIDQSQQSGNAAQRRFDHLR